MPLSGLVLRGKALQISSHLYDEAGSEAINLKGHWRLQWCPIKKLLLSFGRLSCGSLSLGSSSSGTSRAKPLSVPMYHNLQIKIYLALIYINCTVILSPFVLDVQ